MKKYLVFSIWYLVFMGTIITTPVIADDASTSADTAQKLQDLQIEIASKAATIKNQVTQKIDNKAFIGIITSKTDSQIELKLADGTSQIVLINTFTDITYQSTKLTKSILKDDYIAALGEMDDKNNLVAKRLVKLTPRDSNITDQVWGKITTISSPNFVLALKDSSKLSVYTNNSTTFELGNEEVEASRLENNKMVVIIGVKNDQRFNARFVYIVPSGTIIKPSSTKTASSSAKK